MATLKDLTPDQENAIRMYRTKHGRYWRNRLLNDWLAAKYNLPDHPELHMYLQQIRNSFGPSWLKDLRKNAFAENPAVPESTKLSGRYYIRQSRFEIHSNNVFDRWIKNEFGEDYCVHSCDTYERCEAIVEQLKIPLEWTRGESLEAQKECWDINSSKIVGLDFRFASEEEVWRFLWSDPTKSHIKALDIVRQQDHEEYQKILRFCTQTN